MFTFSQSLVSILYVIVLLSETKFQVEAGECDSNSDCTGSYKYCCKKRYSNSVCRHNCIAISCATNSDCGGPNECCRSNICTTLGCGTPNECPSKYDCPYGKYCCKKWHTYYQSSVCRSSCIGQSCDSDSDCGRPNECCDSSKYCTTYNCLNSDDVAKALASWVIGVIVVGVLVVVVIPIAIVVCCCCGAASASRRPAQRGVILSQQNTASTVDVPLQTYQNNPAQFQSPSLPPPYSIDKDGQDLQFQQQTAAYPQNSQSVQNYPPPYSIDNGEQDQFQPPTAASTVDVPLQIQNNNPARFQNPSLSPPYLIDQAQDQFQPQQTTVQHPDYKY